MASLYLKIYTHGREYLKLGFGTKFIDQITREDLIKARQDDDLQIIDVLNKKFYDPETNSWEEMAHEFSS